jgi:pyruvate,water dikinase
LSNSQADLSTVGGKGASLARLVNAELPVPDGFHITTEAYRQFVSENSLQPGIDEALQKTDTSQPATLETASEVIGQLFAQARLHVKQNAPVTMTVSGAVVVIVISLA